MNLGDLSRLVSDAEHSAFRMETLPQYLVPQEEAEFAAWRAGVRSPLPSPTTSPWLTRIADTTACGFAWSRVRIVDRPLCTYSEFELYGLQANSRAGEVIHVADRTSDHELDDLHDDFWLIDDNIGITMTYDGDGRFLDLRRVDDVEALLDMRSRGLRRGIELTEYLTRWEPQLLA